MVDFLINIKSTVVKFVVENFFIFGSVPEDKRFVGGWEKHDFIGVNAESSDGFLMFSEFLFKVPRFPVPKPDQSILMSHGHNMIIDSFKTVDDTLGLFSLLSWLECVLINGNELTIKSTS